MDIMAYVVLGILAAMAVCLVLGAAKLERRQQAWEWLHPPNEDEDGVFLMEDEDEEKGADG